MPIDDEVRLAVEEIVDEILKDPKRYLDLCSSDLMEVGIQPSLETVLAFIAGMLHGIANGIYAKKHNRIMTDEEFDELFDLLGRRAWELRREFVNVFYR